MGPQSSLYGEENKNDLAILTKTRGEGDAFTRFFSGPVLSVYFKIFHHFQVSDQSEESSCSEHQNSNARTTQTPEPYARDLPIDVLPNSSHSRLYAVNNTRLHVIIDFVVTVFSSLAPLSSIIVLYFVQNESIRLVIVCAFTIAFTVSLAVFTRARRVEIFAATAAFAGVQVVFIGSTTGTSNQSG